MVEQPKEGSEDRAQSWVWKRLLPSDCRPSNQGLHILWLWGHIVLIADVPAASPMIRVSEYHVSPFPLD